MSETIGKNKIRVNVSYLGPWRLPFVDKKVEAFYLPPQSTVESLIKSLIARYGEDFEKISGFCNAVVDGKLITPLERGSIKLEDGAWVKFVFGVDGG